MSTNLIINQQTNMKNECCVYTTDNNNNNKIFDYAFLPSIYDSKKNTRDSYIDSTKIVGILQDTNYDIYGKNGDITRDENYLYVRDNNTWKRSPLQMF